MSNRPHRRPAEAPPAGSPSDHRRSAFPQTEHDPLTIEGQIEQYGLVADGVRSRGVGRVLLWLAIGIVSIVALVVVVALIVSTLP